tara:strand:+ start:67 stop:693 length:627 start_codon:yes stop_codon:yes gene_type:complete
MQLLWTVILLIVIWNILHTVQHQKSQKHRKVSFTTLILLAFLNRISEIAYIRQSRRPRGMTEMFQEELDMGESAAVKLSPVNINEVRSQFKYIQTGVAQIIEGLGSGDIVADFYADLKYGYKYLYWINKEPNRWGFVILSMADSTLYVDHIYIEPSCKWMVGLEQSLVHLAKTLNCNRLEFDSPRFGFERLKEAHGWKVKTTTYEKHI